MKPFHFASSQDIRAFESYLRSVQGPVCLYLCTLDGAIVMRTFE